MVCANRHPDPFSPKYFVRDHFRRCPKSRQSSPSPPFRPLCSFSQSFLDNYPPLYPNSARTSLDHPQVFPKPQTLPQPQIVNPPSEAPHKLSLQGGVFSSPPPTNLGPPKKTERFQPPSPIYNKPFPSVAGGMAPQWVPPPTSFYPVVVLRDSFSFGKGLYPLRPVDLFPSDFNVFPVLQWLEIDFLLMCSYTK